MIYTPQELDIIKESEIYKLFGQVPVSSITVADLVTAMKKVRGEPNNLLLLRYAYELLEAASKTSTGRSITEELNSTNQLTYTTCAVSHTAPLGLSLHTPTNASLARYRSHRFFDIPITLSGGVAANLQIVAALSGYSGFFILKSVTSDTPDTYQITAQDEDDTACTGGIEGRVDAVIATAYVPLSIEQLFYRGVTNKALEIDIAGGGGVEKLMFQGEFWYE